MITPIYLAPGQIKARWEWKEEETWRVHSETAQRPGTGGKGPTCEDVSMGQGRGSPGPVVSDRSRGGVGEVILPVRCLVHGGAAEETHPPGLVTKWWLEDSNSSPGTLSRANPRGRSGETVSG